MPFEDMRYDVDTDPVPTVTIELENDSETFLLVRQLADIVLSKPGFTVEETTDYTRVPVNPGVSVRRFEQRVPDTAIETIAVRQIRARGDTDYEFTLFDSQNPGRVIGLKRHNLPDSDQLPRLPEYVIDQSGSENTADRHGNLGGNTPKTIDEAIVLKWLLTKFGLETQKTGPTLDFDTVYGMASAKARGLRIETIIASADLPHSTVHVQNRKLFAMLNDPGTHATAPPIRDRTDLWLHTSFSPDAFDFAQDVQSRHIISIDTTDTSNSSNSMLYQVEASSVSDLKGFVEAALHTYETARRQISDLLQRNIKIFS